eukprot:CCRYP_005580-RA/>CCRYP_005580-RA protein AED:0.05 eAED:0.05 QI:289/0.66/0.75/1/0.66/0.75/4/428/830
MSSEPSSAPPSAAGSVASKAEKHFNTARTPKHCNRGGKRVDSDERGVHLSSAGSVDRGDGTTSMPPSPPRRHHLHVRHPSRELDRPPSPPYDRHYDYGYHAARPPVRAFYDYYDRPYDRYDYRNPPRDPRWNYHHDEERLHVAPRHADPHAIIAHRRSASGDPLLPREQRDRLGGGDSPDGNHDSHPAFSDPHGTSTAESANNSLRAVSSSFSANESLNHESLPSVDRGDDDTAHAKGLVSKHSPGVVTAVDSVEPSDKPGIPHPPSLCSKTTASPTNNHHSSSSPQSDSSWRQLRQIASIDTKDPLLHESQSEELSVKQVNKEVVVLPTPKNKSSPNEGHGLEKSISRTSSLSNSPTEEEFPDKFPDEQDHGAIATAPSEEHYRYPYDAPPPYHPHPQDGRVPYHHAHHPPRGPHPKHPPLPPLSMHYSHQTPPFDENSPSTSTISTKDTRSFFPPAGIMKPKHPVHLKSGREMDREEIDNKRRKTSFEKKEEEDISPANASDFGDIGAVPSWDKNLSGWSVCSGMTGMESLINKDLTGNGVLSAFSFSSEVSKKDKKEEEGYVEGDSPDKSFKGKRKHGHVQFSQSFEQPHSHALSRKRMHDGRTMPPPGRYRRAPHEEYPYPADVPPHLPPPHPYEYPHSARYPPRYPPREYHDDEYYYDYGTYPPRYYDYRTYRPPPHPYPYRPPHEYDYPPQPPRGGPPPLHGALARPPVIPPPTHTAGPRGPIAGGWSKEDDLALMDVMKKHKNVKNWEPIAKKLNRGKRAQKNVKTDGFASSNLAHAKVNGQRPRTELYLKPLATPSKTPSRGGAIWRSNCQVESGSKFATDG